MSNETLFYALGIALVVAALAVSAVGLKFENFPTSRGQLVGVLAIFMALVAATATFAVRNAQDEQAKKAAEAAAEPTTASTPTQTTSTATTTTDTTSTGDTTSTAQASGPGGTVKISADPSGQLAFQESSVSSKPGSVTIDFTNDSPVPHDVKVEDSGGGALGGTDLVTGGTATATVDLAAGDYTFFCDVPGHREAGMEGTLTVK
jgi:plastocyanin